MISEESSDEKLVSALNAGESAAFDVLYHRYCDWVLKMALRVTGHHDDSLDVLQETFAYFVRKFPGFELTATMTTFLYPAVRNFSLAARRKRARSVGASEEVGSLAQQPGRLDSGHADIADLLKGLSVDHREILFLRFVDDLTQPEIAERLNIPDGTVKSRLHHAVRALRESPAARRLL